MRSIVLAAVDVAVPIYRPLVVFDSWLLLATDGQTMRGFTHADLNRRKARHCAA